MIAKWHKEAMAAWIVAFAVVVDADEKLSVRQLQGSACPASLETLQTNWGCPDGQLSDEILKDSSFSSGSNWVTRVQDEGLATFGYSSNGIAVTAIQDNDETPYHIQLIQPLELDQDGTEEGSFYSLCVQAAAGEAGSVQFAVDADGALNFAVAGGGVRRLMSLSGDEKLRSECFDFHLRPAPGKYTGRAVIDLGAMTGKVDVCQVSLRECSVRPQAGGLAPIRRCYLAPLETSGGCTLIEALRGSEFEVNEFGQETSGKETCLQRMRELEGDSFVFSIGSCEIWRCGSRAKLLKSSSKTDSAGEVFSQFCEYQEPKGGVGGLERRSPVYVQLWEWNFRDIARECAEYLGPNGFDAVQISPVTEHILGIQWFTKYQPVGFKLNSRSGNEEQFQEMVATCRKAGVQVMVDVILNHIALPCEEAYARGAEAVMPCKGWAGSPFGNRRINSDQGWKGPELFHNINGNLMGNCPVREDTIPWSCPDSDPPNDCTFCDFKGLPDWNTGLQAVQDTLARHLQELHRIGVTMIRVDAASYMKTEELSAIINRVPWDLVYQEWWDGVPEEKRSTSVGHYRDYKYGEKITRALAVDDINYMADLLNISHGLDGIPAERAVYPLAIHDKRTREADRYIPTYKNGLEFHQQQKFLLAWPKALMIRLWGGFSWETEDDGPPGRCGLGDCTPFPAYLSDNDEKPRCMPTPTESPLSTQEADYQGWVCEHRWEGIAGLVNFRKACRGLAITQTWSQNTKPAVDVGNFAFRVGDSCFAALVRGHNTQVRNNWEVLPDWRLAGLHVGLPEGRYCDLASLSTQRCWDRRSCSREVVVGSDGVIITGTVQEGDLLAIHVGARLRNASEPFICEEHNQEYMHEELGAATGCFWSATVALVLMMRLFLQAVL